MNLSLRVGSLVSVGIVACAVPAARPSETRAPGPATSSPTASVLARAAEPTRLDPCARLEARRRALAVPLPDSLGAEAFTRCRTTDAGAVGLVATHAQGDTVTFVVVLERADGTSATSEPRTTSEANLAPELVVVSRPGSASWVTAKVAGQLVPLPFGARAPVQTRAYFVDAFGGAPDAEYPWFDFVPDANGYLLDFELPSLRWGDPVPYGGRRERQLHGVRVRMPLDSALSPRDAQEPWGSVRRACAAAPAIAEAYRADLWVAAQCARIGGLDVTKVLDQVKARCGALAARAVPLVRSAARADARARDGRAPEKDPRPAREELARVAPPGACFADQDRLWDVDYTARMAPFVVPRVALDPAWALGLPRVAP